ncbi:MAG: VWA domain-containing protein [Eubacterium sp.]|nr:VWA domain-containing protein [Eubacterium sp.]
MKKAIRKSIVFVMAGILLLTGCGTQDGGSLSEAPAAEYVSEGAPEMNDTAAEAGGSMPDSLEKAEEMTGMSENGGANASMPAGESSEKTAGEVGTAEAEYGTAADEAEIYAETEDDLWNAYDRSGGMESKSMQDAAADLYAKKDGYLESCYDFDDEIGCYAGNEEYEEYSKWQEKGFSSVMLQPLSTFSADVDTASYSNLRRLIREGYDLDSLPEGAVRIEEMLNYFSYEYDDPQGMEPFGVTTQIGRCPWNQEAELLMIGLKTEDIDYDHAPASNLVFLLDVSGSMDEPDKLPLLQESFTRLTENLTAKDRVSIVTYAAEDKIVLQGARGNEKQKIKKALNSLEAGGGTYGSKGITSAYALAEENFIEGGNNRVILATDGDLNIGMTSEEELEALITEKKEAGIFLSVLGFGTGNIKDNKMELLADKGNGNYAYIDCLREAEKVLVEEMSATLLTICKDVKFQVEFNPDVVEGYRLLGYENRALAAQDFDDDGKDGGEIGAGHSVTALYEIVLCEPLDDRLTDKEIRDLKYGDAYRKKRGNAKESNACGQEWLTISLRYKKPAGHVSTLLEYPVGYACYRNDPSEDFVFAAAVAEFGLLASHSEYPENASLRHVREALSELKGMDEYKAEFVELVQEVW